MLDTADLPLDRLRVFADDLTGAAEIAAALMRLGAAPVLALKTGGAAGAAGPLVTDLDLRDADSGTVAARLAALEDALGPAAGAPVAFKVDSLLRGPVREILACALRLAPTVVFAPALPAQDRRLGGGIVLQGDRPAHLTPLGRSLGLGPEETDIARRLAGLAPRPLPPGALPDAPGLYVSEAATAPELARIAAAALRAPGRAVALAGSAGPFAALAEGRPGPAARPAAPVLWAIGSRGAAARAQVAGLRRAAADLPGGSADRILETPAEGPAHPDPAVGRRLAETAAAAARDAGIPTIFASGGATARAVARALGLSALRAAGEPQPGLVVLETGLPAPRHLVVRSGSFGDADALIAFRAGLRPERGADRRAGPGAERAR